MLMGRIDSSMEMEEDSVWNQSYNDVVGGIGTGFTLYQLVPLMTIVSVVIALLVGAFVMKGKGGEG
jgi:hypothetical protein